MIANLRTLRALWRFLIDPTRDQPLSSFRADPAAAATAKLTATLDRVDWTPRHQA